MAQDHFVVLASAREKLMARCYVAAERLAEGWKPQSSLDVDILVQVGEAIAVIDRLIRDKAAADPVKAAVAPPFVDVLSQEADLVSA